MVLNKKKFARFLVLLAVTLILVFSLFKVVVYAINRLVKPSAEFQQVLVEIKDGDTAWDIQRELAPEGNVERLLYYSAVANKRASLDYLNPGDKIIFYMEGN